MKFIGDLHIHSHYSRATSRDLVPEQLAFWAQKKGITLVDSGGPLLAKAIERIRNAEVIREPGYDGEFSRIRLFVEAETR